jgi:hypothetical protein
MLGTRTKPSSPAARRRASRSASRGSVLTRSVGEVAGALVRRKLPYGSDALDHVVAGWFDDLAGECAALLREVKEGGVRSALGRAEDAARLRERSARLLDEVQRTSRTMRETLLEHSGAGGVIADFAPVSSAIRHEVLVDQVAAFTRFGARLLQEQVEQELKEGVAGAGAADEQPAAAGSAPP